ncbi:Avirulence protein (Avh) [Phytophthora cinnamomi]|uniref:Avirulence protein (Avh) n=1 Tax=Phytophthora cinnamomi TaxID=4785 RepID=UPI003559CA46|nr:Avirulence protein (Avh) [Phytophthora cinnamomi]
MSGKGKCQRKNKRDRKRKRMRGRRRDECNGESSDTVSHWSSDGGSSDIESNCSEEGKFLQKSRKSKRNQTNKNKKKPRTTRQQAKLLENRDSDCDRLPPTQPTVLPSGEVIRPPIRTMVPKMEGLPRKLRNFWRSHGETRLSDMVMHCALHYRFSPQKTPCYVVGPLNIDGNEIELPNPSTKEIAEKLEAAQLKRWLSYNNTPERILPVLKLGKVDDTFFDIAPLNTWTNYLEAYNSKKTKEAKTFVETLTKAFEKEEGGFIKFLASADNVNKAGATKFKTSPLLRIWTTYMKAFNKEYPFAETTMIQTFTKSYGDEKLATMIQAAAKNPETELFAKNLQTAQFKQWMAEKKTPDVIYKKVLKLDSTDSPNAGIWRAYHNAYDEQYPGELSSFNP